MENEKTFKTPAHEKGVPHLKPPDYIPKILHEPFKLENPSIYWLADYLTLYLDLEFLMVCKITHF